MVARYYLSMSIEESENPQPYSREEWLMGGLLFIAYFAAYGAVLFWAPPSAALYPGAAIALAFLFFAGTRIWPSILFASFAAGIAFGLPAGELFAHALASSLAALVGAWMLRRAHIDPLFRKYRDMFGFLMTVFSISFILPTFDVLTRLGTGAASLSSYWAGHYAGALFSFVILTPFVLRWWAKPGFSRSIPEAIETIVIFALLLAINAALFVFGVTDLFGVYLIYLLLFPLFWIALRLRPRFITLALVITAAFALSNALQIPAGPAFNAQLFSIETFLITLSTIFLIIVSLEEDRRLNTNLMRSQLSTLENAVARISTESRAKNDFIAVLAHELRNPLAPVMSAIDYLKISAPRNKEEDELLEMMSDMMQTVKRHLDDLLDVSRISEGKLTIKKKRIDLNGVLKRAVLSVSHHLRERHQLLSYKEQGRPVYVAGDAVRLEQIFSNLLTNASKYSDPGDVITMTVKRHADTVEIAIHDTGVGIPAESLQQIFTPFHQIGTGSRTQKGLGIGLALVHSFVEVHGGTVTATSEGMGKGSTFSVVLPLSKN